MRVPRRSNRVSGELFSALLLITLGTAPPLGADDEALRTRLAEIDAKFVSALSDLARKYDKAKDPEAAHFFAECALGFGPKDAELATLRRSWESEVYTGRVRGGVSLVDSKPISEALRESSVAYKALFDEVLLKAKPPVPSEKKELIHASAARWEIAKSAADYIRAIQEVNALRRGMGLRAVLWDFEMSQRCILAAWYMGDTGDYVSNPGTIPKGREQVKEAASWGPAVDFAKRECSRIPYLDLHLLVSHSRASALGRSDLLNPDARRIWLGRWTEGQAILFMTLFRIPLIGYREDIPTPTKRIGKTLHEGEATWVVTEDTFQVAGKRIPVVHYPYTGETEVPCEFNNAEYGWADSEQKFLSKAGVPIMIRFFGDCLLSEVLIKMRDTSGKRIPFKLYRDGDKRVEFHLRLPTLLILPERSLEKGKQYTVEVRCKVSEIPYEKTWSFTTQR